MNKLIINTDGGSRGNPGPSACAFVVYDEQDNIVVEDGKYLGVCTNNEAEYGAVILALEKVLDLWKSKLPEEINFRADSKLVVEQLSGRFKVKNPRIKVLHGRVRELEKHMAEISYTYIPRAENYKTDALVNQILDNR